MSRNLFFWGGSCSSSPPPSPPPGQRQAPLHQLTYRENGAAITKTTNFEELLDGLTVLESRGEAARDVEIKLLGERLKEQQCEALASKIRGGLHIKKVAFECNYSFDRDTCVWKTSSDLDALIGDAGLMAVLDSIIRNPNALIETLILKNCNIGYVGMQALEIALQRPHFRQLQVLNMKMNPSAGSHIVKLAQQLHYATLPALTELNLSDCNLGAQGGNVMARVFPGLTQLRKLNLYRCNIELVSLAGIPRKSDGLACFTALRVLDLGGNSLALDTSSEHTASIRKKSFFDDLACLTSLEILNLENCRLKCDGMAMLSKHCLVTLTNLTLLNVRVNGLVPLSNEENNLDDCYSELADGIRHLKKLRRICLNQGGFSKGVARQLCSAIASLPRPVYQHCDGSGRATAMQGPIAVDVYCVLVPPLRNSALPLVLWWDDGDASKWSHYYSFLKRSQHPKYMRGSQLMKVVEAMQGLDHAAYVSHHSVMAAAHDDFAQNMQDGGSSGSADVHSRLAEFHRGKAEEHRGLQGQAGDADKELDDYEKMGADMTDDVHWPLHCGIQEYFAEEVIEHEAIGSGGYGVVKKATILRNADLISRCFCIKTLPYPTQLEPAKRHELHNEIRVMAQFSRKYNEPLELHNGSVRVRQGDWFSFESNADKYTAEFLNTFYCCREVDRSKMPNPREWQLDINGNGICGPKAGPQCSDCARFQSQHNPDRYEDLGYRNLLPIHGVMFKHNPDMIHAAAESSRSGQTFSLVMEYLQFGSLMHRLDLGLAKSKHTPPIRRCCFQDWRYSSSMFIGVDDWELKIHLALGIARGIGAMHRDNVWHRDLKSSNVLIAEYQPFEDVLAIAAARKLGAYPYDILLPQTLETRLPQRPATPASTPAHTPETLHSAISSMCSHLQLADDVCDHADSLWVYYCERVLQTLKGRHLDSNRHCIAAACVYLADQSNKAGGNCSVEAIASAAGCDPSHLARLSSKLGSFLSVEYEKVKSESGLLRCPVFKACVCDFGLSSPSCASGQPHSNNAAKGSLEYMAPEIFIEAHNRRPVTSPSTTPAATSARAAARTAPSSAHASRAVQDSEKHAKCKLHDMWAFGCVLYELATHRRPWFHVLEPSTPPAADSAGSASSDTPMLEAPSDTLSFVQGLSRNLGKFHGGTPKRDNGLELNFPCGIENIPPCLLTCISRCTQKNPQHRPQDIQEIIDELETFTCDTFAAIGSKRAHE